MITFVPKDFVGRPVTVSSGNRMMVELATFSAEFSMQRGSLAKLALLLVVETL